MNFPEKFYSASSEMNTYEKHIAAPFIRKTFDAVNIKKAVIRVCGLGFYELFINGKKITKGLLAPYISNPDDIVYFDDYDITTELTEGKNALGLILGNGMQNAPGGRVWDFDIARFRGVPRFSLALELTDRDGNATVINADESFRWHPSHILFDDLRSGVFADMTRYISDWCSPEFDDSVWENVRSAETPRGEKRICEADSIVITEEVSPVEIKPAFISKIFNNRENMRLDTEFRFDFKDREGTLYDFGVNTAGIVRLKIKGEKGQKIFIQFCEFVDSEGHPSYRNINFYPDGYAQVLHFTCSGDDDVFEPPFTYYGFRYALVYGLADEQKKPETLTMLIANSDIKKRADFTCSDETLNKLFEMSVRSDLANFWYFPTDCPHREKNGWTGDAAVSAEHMLIEYSAEKSLTEWLRNICAAQGLKGNLPGIVPTGGWGLEWGNGPAWDNVLTELCWQIWRLRGDLTPAEECKENILRYLSYIAQRRDEDGLIAIGLGDWLQPGRGSSSPTTPLYITDTVMCVYICKKAADLFNALGLYHHARFAEELRADFRNAIRRNLINYNTMTVISRSQTAQAICIYYDIFEESEKPEAFRVLLKLIAEKDDHLDCGMIGIRVLFHVLSDGGRGDLAYKLITRPDHPSYGNFVKRGLTTLPESFIPESEWDSPDSLDHHFYGDIAGWMIQKVAGIRPNRHCTDVKNADIMPDLFDSLESAGAYYEAPYGRIESKWKKESEKIILEVTFPEDMNGKIILPDGYVFYDPEHWFAKLHNSVVTPAKSGVYEIVKTEIKE